MPRGRFLGLMAAVPRAGGRDLYAVLDLSPDRDDFAVDLYDRQTQAPIVRRPRQFRHAAHRRRAGRSRSGTPVWNNLMFFAVHMAGAEPDRHRARRPAEPAAASRCARLYRTLIFLPTMLSVVIVGFTWNLILSPLWGVAEGALKAVGLGALVRALARPALDRARHAVADLGLAVRRHSDDADLRRAAQHSRGTDRRRARRRARPVPHLLAHQAAAGAADHRPRLDPDLRRQFQRLRSHLFGQGRARRAEFRHPTFSAPSSTAPSSATSCSSAIRRWARRWRR